MRHVFALALVTPTQTQTSRHGTVVARFRF